MRCEVFANFWLLANSMWLYIYFLFYKCQSERNNFQTEANRQMHIALLKQIVTFLNRVKEHIECQKNESEIRLDKISPMVLSKPLNISDLPRSRSVLHVSKNLDYSISSTKKMSTRKISKSINNVNGYRDCNSIW